MSRDRCRSRGPRRPVGPPRSCPSRTTPPGTMHTSRHLLPLSVALLCSLPAVPLPADSTGAIERQWLESRVTRDTAAVTEAPTDTSGRTIYGLSMFRQKTSMFDPSAAGPVDESYVLGPGDQLVLILTGDVELAHSL